jgi:hydroxybutyrate-dimer hydrolase
MTQHEVEVRVPEHRRARVRLRMAATGASLTVAAAVSACLGGGKVEAPVNEKPAFVGTVTRTFYDGGDDDLLTAGLGRSGLGAAAAPPPADPAAPTAAELRRNAIFTNYRAILDISPRGGYGTLYGPNVDVDGNDTLGEGKIAGDEYLAYDDDGSGELNVTMMVQVPVSFDPERPCIVTAASSGSRGVYGAIGSAGEWGLKRGCAVAYTDKGTGVGIHDLHTDTVNLQDGTRVLAGDAGTEANFAVAASATDRAKFDDAYPNRVAFKHAHSQLNPEKDWGAYTLDAIRYAFYVLNEQYAERNDDGLATVRFDADNTLVNASSVSNGGAAAIAAAEQDADGLIDGVAVAEPVLEQAPNPALVVTQGGRTMAGGGQALFDYATLANLYQPCAMLSARAAGSPGLASVLPSPALSTNRCTALKAKGLLSATTPADQAEEALDRLLAAGYLPESNVLHASHYPYGTAPVVATYANAYGRFAVTDRLCGVSFAPTDDAGHPTAIDAAQLAQVFANASGIPPTATIGIVNDRSAGGPLRSDLSISPSTGRKDLNVDGALCHRDLATAADGNAQRVRSGIDEVLRSANLRGKPALIVAGRADTQVPVPFNARPYFGQNRIVEGTASRLSYIEVLNAQHFDAFIDNPSFPGYDARYVPLHYYFVQAMDRMWAHLTQRLALPPSQVVRTTPRGGAPGAAPVITRANVPPIATAPATANLITFSGNTVVIPD